jgi:hypothetical protein
MSEDLGAVFSRRMRVSGFTGAAERLVEANAAELEGLARLFGLPGISALRGDFVLTPGRGGVIAVRLALRARIKQVCVVSLEDFWADVAEDADLRLVPAASVKEGAEVELDPKTLEGPDEIFYAGDTVDLGAVLAEQLALALDPYPRKPGVALPAVEEPEEGENPFAALGRLRRGD